MRILSGWTREFGTPDRILGRRRLLARTAKRFLVEGGESSVGIHGLCLALSPGLEGTSSDPGAGLSLTISFGRIPSDCFSGMATLWEEVRGAIREIDREAWPHFKHMLWEWMHPEMVSHDPNILRRRKGSCGRSQRRCLAISLRWHNRV